MPLFPFPVVQSLPHGGLKTPPEIASRLAIREVTIYNECDLWVDQLFDFDHPDLADVRPHSQEPATLGSVAQPIARCLVDANRAPDSLDNPDGAVKSMTSYGDPIYHDPLSRQEQNELLEKYWRPFHNRLDSLMRQQAANVRLFLDCHNMAQRGPDAYGDPGQARPLICIANMGDSNGEPVPQRGPLTMPADLARKATDLARIYFADLALLEPNPEPAPVAALNQPFAGGYILQHYTSASYQKSLGLRPGSYFGLMVEINRGLIVGNQRSDTPMIPPRTDQIAAVRRRLYQWLSALMPILDEVLTGSSATIE